MKNILIIIILFFNISSVLAQRIINGKIHDAQTNEALVGATITILESPTEGTIADQSGRFTLTTADGATAMIISFVGYETITIPLLESQTNYEIQLRPTNLQLNEVIVTGYDSKRKLLETTGSIGLVTERDIERNNATNLSQMMNHIPGVQVRSSLSLRSSSISVRGMGSRGPGASGRVKIYLNDIALTYADGANAFEDIDAQTIGKIEVIKGPASSIYGASIGGVMNITTQKAKYNEKSIETFGMVQSFGTWRAGVNLKISNNKANIFASYGDQATEGYRQFNYEQRKWMTFFGQFYLSKKISTTVFVNRNRYLSQAPGALSPEQVAVDPRQYQAFPIDSKFQNTGRNILFTRIGISNEWEISDKWTNITTLSLATSDLDHPIPTAYIYNWIQNQNARTRFIYSGSVLGMKTRITFGAEYNWMNNRLNFFGNNAGIPVTPQFFAADRVAVASNTVLFTQAEFNVTPSTLVSVGASANFYTYESTNFLAARPLSPTAPAQRFKTSRTFDPYFAPRIGINQRLNAKMAAHASISYGFTPPSTGDINNGDGTENPNLNPETGVNYEVGLRGSLLNDRLTFDLAAYQMNLGNEIITQTPQLGVSVRVNAGSTTYRGIDAYLSYLVLNNPSNFVKLLRVYASYTYLDSKFVNFVENPAFNVFNSFGGRNLPGNVPNRLFSGLEVDTRVGLYAYATAEYVDFAPINNANTLVNSSYTLLNTKIGWKRTLGKQFVLNAYAGMDNALDMLFSESPVLNPAAQAALLPGGAGPNPIAGQFPYLNPNWGRNFYGGLSFKILLNP